MIKLENVSYQYRNGNKVLEDINIQIQKGEFVCLVGKNGSGKSTLAKLIAGLTKPSKGTVFIDDLDAKKKENFMEIRKKVGIVFQNPETQLLFSKVEEEIRFTLQNLGQDNNMDIDIESALKEVNMEEYYHKDIYEMSMGQKQRIAIAEVLSIKPEYFVFDEPTTMLDSDGKQRVYHILKDRKEKEDTVIYTTNVAEEMLLADRILLIGNHKIEHQLKQEDLLTHVELLKQYDIKIPLSLELAVELREEGIILDPANMNGKEIWKQIKEKMQ